MIEGLRIDQKFAHENLLGALQITQSTPFGLWLIKQIAQVNGYQKTLHPVKVGSLTFDHPIILAEGFDKNGTVIPAMLMGLGFSAVITGTVTEFEQQKNSNAFIKRLPGGSILNNIGFANKGADFVATKIEEVRKNFDMRQLIGVSVGMNRWIEPIDAPGAHARVTKRLNGLVDFFVLNVTSPNTKNLRNNLSYSQLSRIVEATKTKLNKKDLYVKLSPDMTKKQVDDFLQVCREQEVTGVVATNTSIDPELRREAGVDPLGPGGLSGTIIRDLVLNKIRYVHSQAPELWIIAEGGIDSPTAARNILNVGASLLGIYTPLIFKGPSFPSYLAKEAACMKGE